jgi:sugar/nucleoside kinase (ribokinase family)
VTLELWVIGNLTIDDVVLPDGTTSMGMCGGNAIYAALGGRMWSDSVGLSARIGPDFPRSNIRALAAAGVRLDLVEVQAPTIHNWALYESPDHRQFVMRLDSGSHAEQSVVPHEVSSHAASARVCHIAPMPLERQVALVRHFAPCSPLVSLDPHDEYIAGAQDELMGLLRLVDVFLPSRKEAALLYGRDDPVAAARAFAAAGTSVVAIKLGADGSMVLGPGLVDPVRIPAVPVCTVDPTGAGDAYCGAFCATYARTRDPLESGLRASVAGALTVEQYGALSILPFNQTTLQHRLSSLRQRLEHPRTENREPCACTTAS